MANDKDKKVQSNAEVGAPSMENQEMTRMQNKPVEREYQGRKESPERETITDEGRSRGDVEREPGRMQDDTSVRPRSNEDVEGADRGEETEREEPAA